MIVIRRWTGREAAALRQAKRMSIRAFAAHLGVTVATVSNWESRGELARLRTETQQLFDLDLARAPDDVKQRLAALLGIHEAPTTTTTAAMFGDGAVTIITPIKKEAIRSRPVVAVEDVVGAQLLGDYAASLGLRVAYETVPIGGEVNLNRPNLVVICGPRLSRHTAVVLEQDPNLRFVTAPDGCWTIQDRRTGTTHRSGIDQENIADFDVAYLGRLPRPDGTGTLMIFTGIHPQGSLWGGALPDRVHRPDVRCRRYDAVLDPHTNCLRQGHESADRDPADFAPVPSRSPLGSRQHARNHRH